MLYHSVMFFYSFFGPGAGGSLTPFFYFINLFVMVKLGYPENFMVPGCLEVPGKFVVVVGGWWWWITTNYDVTQTSFQLN